MREPRDVFAASDSYVRWLLYFSLYLRMGEFVLGSLIAQFYIHLRGLKPGGRKNAIGTIVFLVAAASMVAIAYLMYAPDVGANVFRKMYMNFGLAPFGYAFGVLRRTISQRVYPAVELAVRAGSG